MHTCTHAKHTGILALEFRMPRDFMLHEQCQISYLLEFFCVTLLA